MANRTYFASAILWLTAIVVTIAILSGPQQTLAANDASRPNIVFIMADDLGIGDAGCYNAQTKIPTPHINQLARQGMRFTDAHSPSGVCSPTRYGVLTGRYAWRSRLKRGVLWGYSRSLIEPGRLTVASLLKNNGYATACVGKWHLGFQSPDLQADDLPPARTILKGTHRQAVEYGRPLLPGPLSVGFDYFFGIPASLDMEPYVFVENDRLLEAPSKMVEKSLHRRQNGGGFWRAGPISPSFKHIDVLPKIAEKATAWLEKQTPDQPFFLYFPLSAPHTPWLPTDEFRDRAKAGYYGDFVAQVDSVVGQVMDTLQKKDLAKNTLLIVTSDNGSHWPPGDIKKWGHAANLHYRGQKADVWEGGHRVPFIACWPGHIAPGAVCDQTICLTDLLATSAEIVKAKLPQNAGEDSFSILPALLGEKLGTPLRPATIHHSSNGTFAIRKEKWKLVEGNLGSGGFSRPSVVKPQPDGPQGQLYDLESDPSEKTNLYQSRADVVNQLTTLLKTIRETGRSR